MSDEEFDGWVGYHCELTAANPEAAASLLATRTVFITDWSATYAELSECTVRLLRFLRVPKFANEHAEAVARELMTLRAERNARPAVDYSAPVPSGPLCSTCGDTGLVAVPHPECICQPQDSPPYLRFYPGTKQIVTGAVLCDAPGCLRGQDTRQRESKRDTKRPRPTLTAFLRQFGTLDVVAMLRDHEREQAALARKRLADGGQSDMAALLRDIRRRAEQQAKEAA
jgi:hypothetical protein